MSTRRDFLRKLGLGLGLFAVSPELLKALDKSDNTNTTIDLGEDTTIDSIKGSLHHLTEEDKELTEKFFKYLKNNNVGFKWERVYAPIFKLKENLGGEFIQTQSYKLKDEFNENWNEGRAETHSQSLSGSTFIFHKYNTIDEYYESLFFRFCRELKNKSTSSNRFYIYSLNFTPKMRDPYTFEIVRGFIIRYAKK